MLRSVMVLLILTTMSNCSSSAPVGTEELPDLAASSGAPPLSVLAESCASAPGASAVALGDLDRDGHLDALVASSLESSLTVLKNVGVAGCPTPVSYASGRGTSALVVADVSGDGYNDVVVASAGDNTVDVHLNQGDGTLKSAITYPVASVTALAMGDLSSSGSPDIIALSSAEDAVRVLKNQGSGVFALDPARYAGGRLLFSLAISQLETSALDLVVVSAGEDRIDILSNSGPNRWAVPRTLQPKELSTPVAVQAADLNGDQRPDLVVANHNGDSILVLLNQGGYDFKATSIPVGRHPVAIAVAELSHDSKPDLAVVNAGDETLQILINQGAGVLLTAPSYKFPTAALPVSVAAGDLDGDGNAELIVVHRQAAQAMLYRLR